MHKIRLKFHNLYRKSHFHIERYSHTGDFHGRYTRSKLNMYYMSSVIGVSHIYFTSGFKSKYVNYIEQRNFKN